MKLFLRLLSFVFPAWMFLGLGIGGDSSSSSDQTTYQIDKRVSGRDGAQVSGDGNTVNVIASDYGAVMAGTELARSALFATALVTSDALSSNNKALTTAQNVFGQAIDSVGKAYETAKAGDQRVVSMVGLAVIGLAAVMVVPALFRKG